MHGAFGMGLVALSLLVLLCVLCMGSAPRGHDRFWVAVAVSWSALGIAAVVGSTVGRWSPAWFAGTIAALTLVCIAWRWRRPYRGGGSDAAPVIDRGPNGEKLLLAAIIVAVAIAVARQAVTPVVGADELNYHASRTVYWIQHASLEPWETTNLRQTQFPFGAELIFGAAAMLGRSEVWARAASALALPLTVSAIILVARKLGASRRAAWGAGLLYAVTPTVLQHTTGLKPDLWMGLPLLGAAYFALRSRDADASPSWCWFASGFFAALAISTKTTALAALPGLAILAVVRGPWAARLVASRQVLLGLVVGVVVSGFGMLCYWNMRDAGHPLGSPAVQRLVRVEPSVEQLRTYAARTIMTLVEWPESPGDGVRRWLEEQGGALADALGATRVLAWESDGALAFRYQYKLGAIASGYGGPGLLWMPTVLFAALACVRAACRERDAIADSRAVVLLLHLPLWIGIVCLVRWMHGGPERFWIPAFALMLPLVGIGATRMRARWPRTQPLMWLALALFVYPAIRLEVTRLDAAIGGRAARAGPLAEAIAAMPRDAVVLFFGDRSTSDYTLLGLRDGSSRHIKPWGTRSFDRGDFARRLRESGATHVLFDHDEYLGVLGGGLLRPGPFIEHLRADRGFREIPLEAPRQRLFERVSTAAAPATSIP